MQINVIRAEYDASSAKDPVSYQNLIVRVSGILAYFVELHKDGQNDLIPVGS